MAKLEKGESSQFSCGDKVTSVWDAENGGMDRYPATVTEVFKDLSTLQEYYSLLYDDGDKEEKVNSKYLRSLRSLKRRLFVDEGVDDIHGGTVKRSKIEEEDDNESDVSFNANV